MGGEQGLSLTKQIVGNFDDILDLVLIPSEHSNISSKVAVISNSNQVRIMDDSFASSPLDGHSDIVLAADASPDGYVDLSIFIFVICVYFLFYVHMYYI